VRGVEGGGKGETAASRYVSIHENWKMLLISDAAADSTRLTAAPFRGRLIAHVSH